jgi:probable phosphoglycerate mutase
VSTTDSTVYLVRHGQSTWNVARRIQGQVASPPLTPLGRRQSCRAASQVAGSGATTLLTSDAVRARQTASVIGSVLGLAPVETPLLREQHWGHLQGQSGDDAWATAMLLKDDEPFPGGESRRDVRARLERLLGSDLVRDADGPVVMVSHGDTIAEAVRLLSGEPSAPPTNGGVICLPFLVGRATNRV